MAHQASESYLKVFLYPIIWGLIILVLSTKGGINVPTSLSELFEVDKLGHAVFYGIFTILLFRSFAQLGWLRNKAYGIAFLIAISYGALLEVVQYTFFPGRYFEVLDIVANISGAMLSWLIIRYFFNIKTLSVWVLQTLVLQAVL